MEVCASVLEADEVLICLFIIGCDLMVKLELIFFWCDFFNDLTLCSFMIIVCVCAHTLMDGGRKREKRKRDGEKER